ncbi:cytochrome P450 [Nocardia brasiliensis]
MKNLSDEPVSLTLQRENPFDPPAEWMRFGAVAPIHPLIYPGGVRGWLVVGHQEARQVLGDSRFSSRPELFRGGLSPSQSRGRPARPGAFIEMDAPEHTRLRRMVTGAFTVGRMRRLIPYIEQLTRDRLDEMEQSGPPADLVTEFALPIPSLVICELLGVPYSDRDHFQQNSKKFLELTATADEIDAAGAALDAQLADLVPIKKSAPGEDLISDLIRGGGLSDEELVGIGSLLLLAGHETTSNMLALGTFALLEHPEQMALLRSDSSLIPGAVEELLRYLTIVQTGLIRSAREDVEVGGQLIRTGDQVEVCLPAVNRAGEQFPNGARLDITAPASAHMAFGYGVHACLGQQLARIEMRIGYRELLARFSTLRLAIPAHEVALRSEMFVYGVHSLPVSWDSPVAGNPVKVGVSR